MKKLFIAFTLFASTFTLNSSKAQELSYGLKVGYGLAHVRATNTLDIYDTKQVKTFNVNAYVDIPLGEQFSFQTGLGVIGKGAKITVGNNKFSTTWADYETTPYYLELPFNAVAKVPVGDIFDKCNFIFGMGPYVGMGIGGKNKVKGAAMSTSINTEENIIFTDADKPLSSPNFYGKYKNFDFGLNALVGLEYHWFTFNVNYQYGAINVNPGANLSAVDRVKHRVWSAAIGVKF